MSDANKALKEKLLSSRKNGFDRLNEVEKEPMESYCRDYMDFLDAGKRSASARRKLSGWRSRRATAPLSGDRP